MRNFFNDQSRQIKQAFKTYTLAEQSLFQKMNVDHDHPLKLGKTIDFISSVDKFNFLQIFFKFNSSL